MKGTEPIKTKYKMSYCQEHKGRLMGYVHPYHTDEYPIVFKYSHYLDLLTDASGPEQVSPHFETVSRTRRIILGITLN